MAVRERVARPDLTLYKLWVRRGRQSALASCVNLCGGAAVSNDAQNLGIAGTRSVWDSKGTTRVYTSIRSL